MYNLPLAIGIAVGTVALVAAIFVAILRIRHNLAENPDLQEFVQRVEEGRAAQRAENAENPSQMNEPPR